MTDADRCFPRSFFRDGEMNFQTSCSKILVVINFMTIKEYAIQHNKHYIQPVTVIFNKTSAGPECLIFFVVIQLVIQHLKIVW